MQSKYELLPTSELSSRSSSPAPPYSPDGDDIEYDAPLNPRTRETREAIRAFKADPRFNRPPPSPWARLALIIFCIFLFYAAFEARKAIWVDFGMGMGEEVEVVDGSY
ncbi:hypothetical protein H1R20_g852, partial [Candolleomyces eurysporus]